MSALIIPLQRLWNSAVDKSTNMYAEACIEASSAACSTVHAPVTLLTELRATMQSLSRAGNALRFGHEDWLKLMDAVHECQIYKRPPALRCVVSPIRLTVKIQASNAMQPCCRELGTADAWLCAAQAVKAGQLAEHVRNLTLSGARMCSGTPI